LSANQIFALTRRELHRRVAHQQVKLAELELRLARAQGRRRSEERAQTKLEQAKKTKREVYRGTRDVVDPTSIRGSL
jgi:hypothetical protein